MTLEHSEIILERCQRSGEKRDYGFNWTHFLARRWSADTPYEVGDRVRPSTVAKQNGFEYVSDGGQSGGKREPVWPTTLGSTVVDGSITWTTQELSVAGLRDRIATSTWTAPPASGITVSDMQAVDEAGMQMTTALFTGGTAGQVYDVLNEIVTVGGKRFHATLRLTIE